MALRPHCLKCGSTSVIFDRDVENGCTSAYCYLCGNRQYQGTDYRGFELREENMVRAKCKNCGREHMTIISRGLCWSCTNVSKKHPDPGSERDAALSAVALKAKRLPGPHVNKKPSDPALADPMKPGKTPRLKKRLVPPSSSDQLPADPGPREDESVYTPAIEIRFATPADRKLYDALERYCHLQRRSPEQQILSFLDGFLPLAMEQLRKMPFLATEEA